MGVVIPRLSGGVVLSQECSGGTTPKCGWVLQEIIDYEKTRQPSFRMFDRANNLFKNCLSIFRIE